MFAASCSTFQRSTLSKYFQNCTNTFNGPKVLGKHSNNLLTTLKRFYGCVREGDRVILRPKERFRKPIFTKPLKYGKKIETHLGNIDHDSIIGKNARDVISTTSGNTLRLEVPTMKDYVAMTPRLVTPLYSADANLIISLLDIHVSPPRPMEAEEPPLEILEAGTGHGGLTLHLARAVHAANPITKAKSPICGQCTAEEPLAEQNSFAGQPSDGTPAINAQRSQRRAVIHTLDVSPSHAKHAKEIVRGFRRGLYAGNVEFHVGDVSAWIDHQFIDRASDYSSSGHGQFLSHIILDLPESFRHLAKAASALRTDGVLMIFNPSITQIVRAVKLVREESLPLKMECVIEVGPGIAGGRDWDVRAVRPRKAILLENKGNDDVNQLHDHHNEEVILDETQSLPEESPDITVTEPETYEMICRPKVTEVGKGSGFLAVWRKMKRHGDMIQEESGEV